MGCGNWGISVLGNESLGKKGVFGVLDEVYGLGQLFCWWRDVLHDVAVALGQGLGLVPLACLGAWRMMWRCVWLMRLHLLHVLPKLEIAIGWTYEAWVRVAIHVNILLSYSITSMIYGACKRKRRWRLTSKIESYSQDLEDGSRGSHSPWMRKQEVLWGLADSRLLKHQIYVIRNQVSATNPSVDHSILDQQFSKPSIQRTSTLISHPHHHLSTIVLKCKKKPCY